MAKNHSGNIVMKVRAGGKNLTTGKTFFVDLTRHIVKCGCVAVEHAAMFIPHYGEIWTPIIIQMNVW